ncbi:MAG: UbiX family flavin prenyltransferase [Bacteroidetes bacterium]|nr:UbiX family flavin prenyltransferase [Bacteroidota bacterium]
MRIVVGITGASGVLFAREFLRQCDTEKYLIVSKWGSVVLRDELGITERDLLPYVQKYFHDDDLTAPIASGSNKIDAVVILPCSTSTLGKIASGIGDTLITRVAHVALKERWKLILCVRETPLSTITLEHAMKLSMHGALIMPISPPFYTKPSTLDDVIAVFVEKLCNILGIRESRGWRSENLE